MRNKISKKCIHSPTSCSMWSCMSDVSRNFYIAKVTMCCFKGILFFTIKPLLEELSHKTQTKVYQNSGKEDNWNAAATLRTLTAVTMVTSACALIGQRLSRLADIAAILPPLIKKQRW